MLKWWIFLSIIALTIDALTSNFFFICFTIGGLVAIAANFLGYSPIIQAIIFCIVSIVSIILVIPYIRSIHKEKMGKTVTLEDRYIGRSVVLDQDIFDDILMKVDGIYWTIKNIGDPMSKGDRAVIVGVEGNKLLIKKESEEG